ncbi:MAG: response regulator, partial [Balneolales bacterium]|nr:response regulator [Balneolales bacterium]
AFQMVKKDWFDIIFMDIQMPVMDGFEASRAISNLYKGRQKPIIIAVTANVLGTDIEEYTSAGINEYISKPITKNSLWDVLSKFI